MGLLLNFNANAEIKLIEKKVIDQGGNNRSMVVSLICVDGYKFVTLYDKAQYKADAVSGTSSITQMFMRSTDKNSFPARC